MKKLTVFEKGFVAGTLSALLIFAVATFTMDPGRFLNMFGSTPIAAAVVTSQPAAAAASLNDNQVSAIISLLTAFGVNQETIGGVEAILRGRLATSESDTTWMSDTTGANATTSNTQSIQLVTKPTSSMTKPSCKLTATPSKIKYGQSTVLSWRSEHATNAAWVRTTDGKDNIAPPSGVPETNGSVTFLPSISEIAGTTMTPWVTLSVFGPGGTSTCTAYITISSSVQATFDSNVFTQTSATPTISGTATGVSQVAVVLGNTGGKVYGSGLIPVVNGHWSVTVNPPLATGQYFIYVYDGANNMLTNGGYLKVTSSSATTTPYYQY